jgi:hypothetical protein
MEEKIKTCSIIRNGDKSLDEEWICARLHAADASKTDQVGLRGVQETQIPLCQNEQQPSVFIPLVLAHRASALCSASRVIKACFDGRRQRARKYMGRAGAAPEYSGAAGTSEDNFVYFPALFGTPLVVERNCSVSLRKEQDILKFSVKFSVGNAEITPKILIKW